MALSMSTKGRCLRARFASSRASQAWYMDFAVALLLFTFTLVAYFGYTTNFQKEEKGELDIMIKDAKSISTSLALSGYPTDWDNTTVIRIGIANEQKLNESKMRLFSRLKYNDTKRKFATIYDYFVFFVNNKGEVLNINGICGVGEPLINVTYNIKSAYYYQDPADSFLKDFMNETFKADIYFGDNPDNLNDIDALISNLGKYGLVVMEHPLLTTSVYNIYKDELNNYTSSGGLFMISGELVTAQNRSLVGVNFFKKAGLAESERNATVNNTDQYLSLTQGQYFVFAQAYYVENTSSAVSFKQIATFNADQRNALSKWKYGNGTVYFFSDFDVSFFSGSFVSIVEDLVKSLIEGTCSPFNVTQGQKKLVKTERYLIYKSKPVKMIVYLWQ